MHHKSKFKETEIGMIPEDWEVKELNDLCNFEMGQSPPSKSYNSGGEGILFLQGVRTFGKKYPLFDTWTTNPKKIAKKGEVLFSVRAPVGEVNITKKDICIGRGLSSLSMKNKNNEFLYYMLIHLKNRILGRQTGTVYGSINKNTIQKLKMPCPSFAEQSIIAKILSDLDSKIENNQQMSEKLEAIGLALFNNWFNANNIKGDWEVKPLDEIAEYLNGLALQKYPAEEGEDYLPVIKIRELRNGITEQTDKANVEIPEDYVIEDGDVLFSWSGTLEVELWTSGQGALNQHLFKVSSKDYPKWFYYYWTKHHLKRFRHIAKGKATTMGHIQRHNLKGSEVIIPDKKSLENMDKIMSSIIERIIDLRLEARNLSKIRDSLLPRLMSGRIRVPVEVKI